MKLVEPYGEVASIPADSQAIITEFEIPTGYAAELFAIGVAPDLVAGASYLDHVYLAVGDVSGTIGSKIEHSNFSANHLGKNAVPYGGASSEQPMLLIDTPATPGNLTYKFPEAKFIQLVGVNTDVANATGKVFGRMKVYLLDAGEVSAIYGTTIAGIDDVAGGIKSKERLWAEFYDNPATAGKGRFEDLASITVRDYETINLKKIGVKPADHAETLKLYNYRTKEEFPEYEPFWTITPEANVLPFGDDADKQPMQELPDFIKTYMWNNTLMKVQMRDDNNVVSAGTVRVQLIGKIVTR